ncbi:MAG: hypothetical protein EBZ60_06625, partial [Betaproteobacteria bacterium]|nr:hypothetical protein [Betaproteobacteria bacterium]
MKDGMAVTETMNKLPGAGWAFVLLLFPGLWLLRMATAWLSGASLFVDEAQYWDWSRQLAWGYFSKPPVLPWLIKLSSAVGGDSAVGVRWLVQALWGMITLVMWRLGWEMQRDSRLAISPPHATGAWAAALVSATLVVGILGQVATTDGPLMCCWALSMWLMWRALQQPDQWSRWVLLGLVLAAGVLSKYTMAAVLLSWAVLWWQQPRGQVFKGMCLAAGVAVLCWLPHLAWNQANGWPTLKHTAELLTGAAASPAEAVGVWALRALAYIAGQALIIGPVVLVMAWRAYRHVRRNPSAWASFSINPVTFAWHFAWPLWVVGGWQALQGNAQINWPAPAVLGTCTVLAIWLASRTPSWRWSAPAMVVISSNLLCSVIGLGGDWRASFGLSPLAEPWSLWARAQGWDEAFQALQPSVETHPDATLVGLDRTVIAHAAYAWRAKGWTAQSWQRTPYPDHHYDLTNRFTPDPNNPAHAKVLLLVQGSLPAFVHDYYAQATPLQPLRSV